MDPFSIWFVAMPNIEYGSPYPNYGLYTHYFTRIGFWGLLAINVVWLFASIYLLKYVYGFFNSFFGATTRNCCLLASLIAGSIFVFMGCIMRMGTVVYAVACLWVLFMVFQLLFMRTINLIDIFWLYLVHIAGLWAAVMIINLLFF